MGHFAKVNAQNIVTDVVVAEYDFLEANPQLLAEGEQWVRTSYNTRAGTHPNPNKTPLRFNYAGVGYTFDPSRGEFGAFIPPKPFPSWVLNEDTCLWEPPVPYPFEDENGDPFFWDEDQTAWVKQGE